MNQLTLRQIPDRVAEKLRAAARERGESINKTAIHLLSIALRIEKHPSIKRKISNLAGTWSQEEADEFEKHVAFSEIVDEDVWQ